MQNRSVIEYSDVLLEQCRSSKAAVESAWRNHYDSVMRYKSSKAWQATYASFAECCKANKEHFYAESSYRNLKMDIIVAEIIEAVADVELTKTQARKNRENFAALIPDEDRKLLPSIWQICHEYAIKENKPDELITPRKDVILEAYAIIRDERDSNTLNVNGETFNVKSLAHSARIKERVLENISGHTVAWQKARFVANTALVGMLAGMNSKLPPIGTELIISWKGE